MLNDGLTYKKLMEMLSFLKNQKFPVSVRMNKKFYNQISKTTLLEISNTSIWNGLPIKIDNRVRYVKIKYLTIG